MYDVETDKMLQFSSDVDWSFKDVYQNMKRIKKGPDAAQKFETYTNKDYETFELVDFRTLRY